LAKSETNITEELLKLVKKLECQNERK